MEPKENGYNQEDLMVMSCAAKDFQKDLAHGDERINELLVASEVLRLLAGAAGSMGLQIRHSSVESRLNEILSDPEDVENIFLCV